MYQAQTTPELRYKKDPDSEKQRHLQSYGAVFRDIVQRSRLAERGLSNSVEGKVMPHKDHGRLQFARHALEYTKQLPPHDSRMIYSSILSALPSFMRAKAELEQDRNESRHNLRMNEHQHDSAIDETIRFNDVIRDIIDQHHNKITPDVLLRIISTAAISYKYSTKERAQLLIEAEGVIRGMQHELAFESSLYYLPEGFEVLDRSEAGRDDANGKDYRVRCPNGTVVSIDVKASLKSAEKAIQKRDDHFALKGMFAPRNELIHFSGFSQDDFGMEDPWRPKHDAVLRELPKIEATLVWASGGNSGKNRISSMA